MTLSGHLRVQSGGEMVLSGHSRAQSGGERARSGGFRPCPTLKKSCPKGVKSGHWGPVLPKIVVTKLLTNDEFHDGHKLMMVGDALMNAAK